MFRKNVLPLLGTFLAQVNTLSTKQIEEAAYRKLDEHPFSGSAAELIIRSAKSLTQTGSGVNVGTLFNKALASSTSDNTTKYMMVQAIQNSKDNQVEELALELDYSIRQVSREHESLVHYGMVDTKRKIKDFNFQRRLPGKPIYPDNRDTDGSGRKDDTFLGGIHVGSNNSNGYGTSSRDSSSSRRNGGHSSEGRNPSAFGSSIGSPGIKTNMPTTPKASGTIRKPATASASKAQPVVESGQAYNGINILGRKFPTFVVVLIVGAIIVIGTSVATALYYNTSFN